MWIADKWKSYEVLDCSMGEKLENWGEYTLVRPDPQVIWSTKKSDKGWKNITDIITVLLRAAASGNHSVCRSSGV